MTYTKPLALAILLACCLLAATPAAAASGGEGALEETKTEHVLDVSKLKAALTADALKELVDKEDKSSPVHGLEGAALKKKVTDLATAAKPVFDEFFKHQEKLWEDNKEIITFAGVSPKVKDAAKGTFEEGRFVITAGVGKKGDEGKIKWGAIPPAMRQAEVFEHVTEEDLEAPAQSKDEEKALLEGEARAAKSKGRAAKGKGAAKANGAADKALSPTTALKNHRLKGSRPRPVSLLAEGAEAGARAIGAHDVYIGTSINCAGRPSVGALGYIVSRGDAKFAVTNGHVCRGVGKMILARTRAGAYDYIGESLASVQDRSSDTCISSWDATDMWGACETADGKFVPKSFTKLPSSLSALNMLVGRRVTQYGPRPKGVLGADTTAIQRSFGKVRYWGFRKGFAKGGRKSWGQYVVVPVTPTSWFDSRGAVDFGVSGDSGTAVMSTSPGTHSTTIGQYWGSKKPPRRFRHYFIAPIHKHRRIWETAAGGPVTLCK